MIRKTASDYWVLDKSDNSWHRLGSKSTAGLMFAKLSPDGKKAAYLADMNPVKGAEPKWNLYVEEIKTENQVFSNLKAKAGSSLDLQMLSQAVAQSVLNDFPDKSLTLPLGDLLMIKFPESFKKVSDLEPGKAGQNWDKLDAVCNDVRKNRQDLKRILKTVRGLTFYEFPKDNPLDLRVPR